MYHYIALSKKKGLNFKTGYNKWGQLGRGDSQDVGDGPLELGDNLVPLDMGTGEVISEVALGEDFTCALLESGSVKVR